MLVGGTILGAKHPPPQRRINFNNHGTARRGMPPVKRPKMHTSIQISAQAAQPWQPSVRGLRDTPLHVEMEDGLRPAPPVRDSPPPRVTKARRGVSAQTSPHGVDPNVITIGGPMLHEIIEEIVPIQTQTMRLKKRQRERKRMINPNQSRRTATQNAQQPLRQATARPILFSAGYRENFSGRLAGRGRVHP